MKITQQNYTQVYPKINFSKLPPIIKDGHDFYLELTSSGEDWASVPEIDEQVTLYFKKLNTLADRGDIKLKAAKKKGSGKATKARATRAKAAKATRTEATKKKAAKRAENKPKLEDKPKSAPKEKSEKFKVGTFVKVKTTGFVMKVVKNRGVEGADYLVADLEGQTLLADQSDLVFSAKPKVKAKRNTAKKELKAKRAESKPKAEQDSKEKPNPKKKSEKFKVGTFVKVKTTGFVMKVVKNRGVEGADYLVADLEGETLLADQKDLVFSAKPKGNRKRNTAKKDLEKKADKKVKDSKKSASKTEEKQAEKLKEVKVEFNEWIKKVEKEEENLKKVISLVSPTVKNSGMGLTKTQLEIKQYEAYITILKKVYNRDAKMMKGIMDKAQKALRPQDVLSLSAAIVKAQGILTPQVGMSGIRETLKAKPKKKGKSKAKTKAQPKAEPKKKGFFARIFS